MATKIRARVFAAVALFSLVGGANAAIIDLNPAAQFVTQGDQFAIDLSIGFDIATIGGSLDVFYDSALLSFVGFKFDPNFLGAVADPDLSFAPENCFADGSAFGGCIVGDGELNALAFGNFDGIFGIHHVGTFIFEALSPGTATLFMMANDMPFEGEGFLDLDGNAIDVVANAAQVFIQPVPIPAAFWMMLTALGAMAGMRRR